MSVRQRLALMDAAIGSLPRERVMIGTGAAALDDAVSSALPAPCCSPSTTGRAGPRDRQEDPPRGGGDRRQRHPHLPLQLSTDDGLAYTREIVTEIYDWIGDRRSTLRPEGPRTSLLALGAAVSLNAIANVAAAQEGRGREGPIEYVVGCAPAARALGRVAAHRDGGVSALRVTIPRAGGHERARWWRVLSRGLSRSGARPCGHSLQLQYSSRPDPVCGSGVRTGRSMEVAPGLVQLVTVENGFAGERSPRCNR